MNDLQFTYYGLDQVTQVSPEAWEEFFRLCREYAAVARQCRAERMAAPEEARAVVSTT